MNNKYNLDFNEAVNFVNSYLDTIEDNLNTIKTDLKDSPDMVESILHQMKTDEYIIQDMEFMLADAINKAQHQQVLNQILLNDVYYMFMKEVLPKTDVEPLRDYIDSLDEEIVIENITDLLDEDQSYRF